jgi:serine/threonine protein kinase
MYITTVNQYTLVSTIGKGAFGEITLATDQNNNCYAIKNISKAKKQVENINREVKAGQILKHKNVVKFVEHLDDDGHDYLVFEYVNGESDQKKLPLTCLGYDLFSYLEKKRKFVPFSECEARVIIRQLVQVLLFCHSNGVIHLDVRFGIGNRS